MEWMNRWERVGKQVMECAEMECLSKGIWRLFCCNHPLEGSSCEETGQQTLDYEKM